MKEMNLLVCVKRAGQTTKSLQVDKPWTNLLEILDVSHQNQAWVGDVTYVRVKGRFVYVAVLMDVFSRMIKGWKLSQHLTQSLTLKPLEEALCQSVPEIHHSDQGVQYLSSAYISTLTRHGIEISLAHRAGLGRTDMPKDSSAHLRRKKSTSMTIKASPRPEIASVILSHTSLI